MSQQVEASTVTAVQLIGSNRFVIPDFQREYSWVETAQVKDFWEDLSSGLGNEEYFMGLLIFTDAGDRREVVDGQQRLITLTLLANALRLAAIRENRKLVAENLRSTFLFSVDFQTEVEFPRTSPTARADFDDLYTLLNTTRESDVPEHKKSNIYKAFYYLSRHLRQDLDDADSAAVRLGQWAEFISQNLTFAVFVHPDRSAAFRVYEIINTRGKDLTPSELIKSYLIGSSEEKDHQLTYSRWKSIENQFDELDQPAQLTGFVRHVATLRKGYIVPRELYRVVTETYAGSAGVETLLAELESSLPTYVKLIDPTSDIDSSDVTARSYSILNALGAGRFRPIFLLSSQTSLNDDLLPQILKIIIPGIIGNRFGAGSVEAQFARATRRIYETGNWEQELARLALLKPDEEEFKQRVVRGMNRNYALVVRSAVLQQTAVPSLDGYLHQIRPAQAADWPSFDDENYRQLGSTVGNSILLKVPRRPHGTRTRQAVRDKIFPERLEDEIVTKDDLRNWNVKRVAAMNQVVANLAAGLWYA